jgi:hypothetical protein
MSNANTNNSAVTVAQLIEALQAMPQHAVVSGFSHSNALALTFNEALHDDFFEKDECILHFDV